MSNLSKEKKHELLDSFGRILIEKVRDSALSLSMAIANQTTINSVSL